MGRLDRRIILFDVVDGRLVRTVTLPNGRTYVHRCTREVYENVAHEIEERAAGGVTLDGLAEAMGAPSTQVNVALEFMKERGVVVTRDRRSYPASQGVHADAMIEFMYLAEAPY